MKQAAIGWLRDLAELVCVAAGITLLLVGLQAGLQAASLPAAPGALIGGMLDGVAVLALYALAVRGFERRSALSPATGELRLAALRLLPAGLLLGLALFSLALAILLLAGVARVTAGGGGGAVAGMLASACAAGISEEILFRGVLFGMVARRAGPVSGLVVTSVLFAAAHLGNGGGHAVGAMAGIASAGLLLGAARLAGRCLWLPIGLHAGWNATEGSLYGADVSGYQGHGLLLTTLHGPVWLSGGRFGAEAGLPVVLVCLAGAAGLLATAWWRDRAGQAGRDHPEPVQSRATPWRRPTR